MSRNEEGSKTKWICAWVPCAVYSREREGDKQKSTVNKEYQKWEWKGTYAWTMHEHVTCKEKLHYGLNPIQSYQHTRFQHIKHTSIMHETLWECKCNAMHGHITSFKQNPTQKFHKILIDFQKPQKFHKNPKPRSKCVKCMKNKRLKKNTRGKKPKIRLKSKWGRWMGWGKSVWERKINVFVERNRRKMNLILRWTYLRKSRLDGLRIYRDFFEH